MEALMLLCDWWQQNFPSKSFDTQNAAKPN